MRDMPTPKLLLQASYVDLSFGDSLFEGVVCVGCSVQLGVVAPEFLFRAQPVIDMVTVLPAPCLVQAEGESGNFLVRRGEMAARVHSHALLAGGIRQDNVS